MKLYLSIFLSCLFVLQISAQSNMNAKSYIGVRGGANIANLTNTHGDAITDFYVGGLVTIKATPMFHVQFEVDYSRQGANNVLERNNRDMYALVKPFYETDIKVDYVDFKILSKFQLKDVNLVIGGGGGILLNTNKEKYNDVDVLFVLGIGYDITKKIGVEARWKHGLKTINKTAYKFSNSYKSEQDIVYSYYYRDNIRNNVFQLGVYYKF